MPKIGNDDMGLRLGIFLFFVFGLFADFLWYCPRRVIPLQLFARVLVVATYFVIVR